MHFGGDLLQDGILFLPSLSRLGRKYRVFSLSHTHKLWLLGPRPYSGPALGVVFLSGPGRMGRGRGTH